MFLKFLLVLLLIVFYINNQFAAPRIGIDVPAIEFGDVEANSKLVREVRIANSGDEQLSVSRVKACCGANASLAETTIASGTSSVLRVEFNPGAKPGPFRKTVTLYSNDPVSPVLIIPLTTDFSRAMGKLKNFGFAVKKYFPSVGAKLIDASEYLRHNVGKISSVKVPRFCNNLFKVGVLYDSYVFLLCANRCCDKDGVRITIDW